MKNPLNTQDDALMIKPNKHPQHMNYEIDMLVSCYQNEHGLGWDMDEDLEKQYNRELATIMKRFLTAGSFKRWCQLKAKQGSGK